MTVVGAGTHGVYRWSASVPTLRAFGRDAAAAMGIDWTEEQSGLSQAIPPAYTEFLGRQVIDYLGSVTS